MEGGEVEEQIKGKGRCTGEGRGGEREEERGKGLVGLEGRGGRMGEGRVEEREVGCEIESGRG